MPKPMPIKCLEALRLKWIVRDLEFPKHFWDKVAILPSGCWEWKSSISSMGYGTVTIRWKAYLAHRIAYILTYGPIPDGRFICHHCDNPKCVRPSHLFAGSAKDNQQDSIGKGRRDHIVCNFTGNGKKGEANPASKYTEAQIKKVKELLSKKIFSYAEITRQTSVGKDTVQKISSGKTWTHL